MNIGKFEIGEKSGTFIIAELSANHGHDINIAKETIKAAKKAGADAIKIQTYTADTLTIDCDNEYFKLSSGTIWDGRTLYDLYSEAFTPWEWQEELMEYAKELGLIFFSTPFDKTAVDFLEKLNVPA
ncbi:MAG: pseudaminic acid synthase, partial [Tissierellia bacterium]|nr:pseudaminic acid synthase [Tissierellia bacterium]